jgi:hypothetical protein
MGLDLYKPDYEQTVRAHAPQSTSMEQLVNDMGELVFDQRRRDTFPVRFRCSLVFACFGLIFWNPAKAIGPFDAICIALSCVVLVFACLSSFRELGS